MLAKNAFVFEHTISQESVVTNFQIYTISPAKLYTASQESALTKQTICLISLAKYITIYLMSVEIISILLFLSIVFTSI